MRFCIDVCLSGSVDGHRRDYGRHWLCRLFHRAASRIAVQIPGRILEKSDFGVPLAGTTGGVFATLGNRDIGSHVPALHLPDQRTTGAVALQ